MKMKRTMNRKMRSESAVHVCATLGFPPEVCESLKIITPQKKVLLALAKHDAAEQYITCKRLFFAKKA
jgi:hypothetical protein